MFTIKQVLAYGHERIFEAEKIYVSSHQNAGQAGPATDDRVLTIKPPGSLVHETLDEGSVFVMNENGMTVAQYHPFGGARALERVGGGTKSEKTT